MSMLSTLCIIGKLERFAKYWNYEDTCITRASIGSANRRIIGANGDHRVKGGTEDIEQ